jgi:hypothetical protein
MSAIGKTEVLRSMSFGARIAEEEGEALRSYFVETDQWRRLFSGEVDVVYGPKGSGKSAIYFLLLGSTKELLKRRIVPIPAENPRGTPAFKDLTTDPPASEDQFRDLWKLYFLCLIAAYLRHGKIVTPESAEVIKTLEDAGLLPAQYSLQRLLKSALDYLRHLEVEAGVKVDPTTGTPEVSGKVMMREPGIADRKAGFTSVDDLLRLCDQALLENNIKIWLVLDRLDVAFAETSELENNALRALFRVYLDLASFPQIALKIFLRSDIWNRLTTSGFREASHITKTITLSWTPDSLLNLVIRRIVHNDNVRNLYRVESTAILTSTSEQRALFYRIFPNQVDVGEKRLPTFEWMLSRTADGTKETAPRELIHLLSASRDVQLHTREVGGTEPPEENLFDRSSLKSALPQVSKARLHQTLFAEFPQLRQYLQKLDGEKTQQNPRSLAKIWKINEKEALEIADRLTDVGFFEKRGQKADPSFWVPFLYRDALSMSQGSALI